MCLLESANVDNKKRSTFFESLGLIAPPQSTDNDLIRIFNKFLDLSQSAPDSHNYYGENFNFLTILLINSRIRYRRIGSILEQIVIPEKMYIKYDHDKLSVLRGFCKEERADILLKIIQNESIFKKVFLHNDGTPFFESFLLILSANLPLEKRNEILIKILKKIPEGLKSLADYKIEVGEGHTIFNILSLSKEFRETTIYKEMEILRPKLEKKELTQEALYLQKIYFFLDGEPIEKNESDPGLYKFKKEVQGLAKRFPITANHLAKIRKTLAEALSSIEIKGNSYTSKVFFITTAFFSIELGFLAKEKNPSQLIPEVERISTLLQTLDSDNLDETERDSLKAFQNIAARYQKGFNIKISKDQSSHETADLSLKDKLELCFMDLLKYFFELNMEKILNSPNKAQSQEKWLCVRKKTLAFLLPIVLKEPSEDILEQATRGIAQELLGYTYALSALLSDQFIYQDNKFIENPHWNEKEQGKVKENFSRAVNAYQQSPEGLLYRESTLYNYWLCRYYEFVYAIGDEKTKLEKSFFLEFATVFAKRSDVFQNTFFSAILNTHKEEKRRQKAREKKQRQHQRSKTTILHMYDERTILSQTDESLAKSLDNGDTEASSSKPIESAKDKDTEVSQSLPEADATIYHIQQQLFSKILDEPSVKDDKDNDDNEAWSGGNLKSRKGPAPEAAQINPSTLKMQREISAYKFAFSMIQRPNRVLTDLVTRFNSVTENDLVELKFGNCLFKQPIYAIWVGANETDNIYYEWFKRQGQEINVTMDKHGHGIVKNKQGYKIRDSNMDDREHGLEVKLSVQENSGHLTHYHIVLFGLDDYRLDHNDYDRGKEIRNIHDLGIVKREDIEKHSSVMTVKSKPSG